MTVSSALALLFRRERGGEAGYAEVALSEAAASLAEPLRYGCTAAGALLGGGIPEYNIYKTVDGWVAVAALEPHFKNGWKVRLPYRRRTSIGLPLPIRVQPTGRSGENSKTCR